jgi:uncharacterized membrane protein
VNAVTIATLLPVAIGLALSPAALIQLILVLFSRKRVVNSIAFVGSLLVFSAAAMALGGLGASAVGEQPDKPDSPVVSVVLAVFGLLLLVVGWTNWRNRADTSEPAAMAAIANMGPGAVAFLSLGATFINPKNLPLLISAGATTAATPSPLLVGLVFLLIATAPYTVAMVYSLAGGERAAAQLDRVRAWLVARNRLIMGVICLLLGLVLLIKGVTALL